jgi:primase-polymerase (primpol)-like protein
MSTTATPAAINAEAIPQELKDRNQWVVWKYEERGGDRTKVLYTPGTRSRAKSNTPKTWRWFEEALRAYESGEWDGIGYVFNEGDPYAVLDLDKCRDAETGEIELWAWEYAQRLDSYTEISVSGRGLHVVVRGKLPPIGRKSGQVEMYDHARFVGITGHLPGGCTETIEDRQNKLEALHAEVFAERLSKRAQAKNGSRSASTVAIDDEALLTAMFASRHGAEIRALWAGDQEAHKGKDRSPTGADLALCNHLAFWTGRDAGRMDRLFRCSGLMRDKWDRNARQGETYGQGTIRIAIEGCSEVYTSPGKGPKLEPSSNGNGVHHDDSSETVEHAPELPDIITSNRPLRDISDDAFAALVATNDPPTVFVRSGELTRVREDEHGRPIIEPFGEVELRGRMARTANYFRARVEKGTDKDTGAKVEQVIRTHVPPPKEVVQDVLKLGSWDLPILEGVVESPTLRPDGSILDTPGYDPLTRLLYLPTPGLEIPPIPEHPTAEQIAEALAIIQEPISEFPFADTASRANTLAAMLTPVVRHAIGGHVPLALFDKPRAGTGASLLADVISLIATGRRAGMMTAPRKEEEWQKSILSVLVDGASVITIDNIEYTLQSPSLASAITSYFVQGRPLGQTAMIRVPQRATWIATGNNVQLGGDMPRRCYWIRMDATQARPWERTGFVRPDLAGWVLQHRGQLLSAILTLTRGWYAAGRPTAQVPAMGSFEEWTKMVGGILAFAGVEDFLTNLTELWDQADESANQWEAFLATWHSLFSERKVTVAEICDAFATKDDAQQTMRDVLPEELAASLGDKILMDDGTIKQAGPGFRRQLGRALEKRADAMYGNFKLRRAGKHSNTKATLWTVVAVSPAVSPEGEPWPF